MVKKGRGALGQKKYKEIRVNYRSFLLKKSTKSKSHQSFAEIRGTGEPMGKNNTKKSVQVPTFSLN